MNHNRLEALIESRHISRQKHPHADLWIYNYTQKAQYENVWTDETLACRGLIMDGNGEVQARPFRKFFNFDQVEVPAEPFEAFEKLDGSLGISYWDGMGFRIATRGSFVSDQSREATEMLLASDGKCEHGVTLLFEILYPENRIVVNYGGRRELILLAAIETATGRELPYSELPRFGFPVVERYDGFADFAAISAMQRDGCEGFVVRFESGLRVKIKHDEYKRLHKLLTGVTPRHIWESLRAGKSMAEFAEHVPDEFHKWLQDVEAKIRGDYHTIEAVCAGEFRDGFENRKAAAEYFKGCSYPPVMFLMHDGRDYSQAIWRQVYPEAANTFRCGE